MFLLFDPRGGTKSGATFLTWLIFRARVVRKVGIDVFLVHGTDVHMTSPANVREPAMQVVDSRAPLESARALECLRATRPVANSPVPTVPVAIPRGRFDQNWLPANAPSANSNSGVLGSSLQRLYDSRGNPAMVPPLLSQSQLKKTSETTSDLTESLLEAVFEISEFDPLPHLNYRDEEFGFGSSAVSPPHPTSTTSAHSQSSAAGLAPGPVQGRLNASPDALSGMDRRKLPRRESECVVSVYRCRGDERPMPDRIAWLLHATKLKGQLIDVSMSGAALHLMESLAPGSRILLRISNRTIDKHVDASAMILRSREASDAGYDMVCRFEKKLTFEQIHAVGRSLFAATIV